MTNNTIALNTEEIDTTLRFILEDINKLEYYINGIKQAVQGTREQLTAGYNR